METESRTLWHRVKCQLCGKEFLEPVFDDLPTPFCEDVHCNGHTDEIKFSWESPHLNNLNIS